MNIKRVWNTAVLTLMATGLWTVAQGCGPSIGSFCNKVCDCVGCSDSKRDDCVDSLEDTKKAAEEKDCGSEFNDYLSCTTSELECKDGYATADGCDAEAKAFSKCTKGSVIGGGSSVQDYCGTYCDCQGCGSGEEQDCVSSLTSVQQQSEDQGCLSEFNSYLTCVANSAECQGGELVLQGCNVEASDFSDCFGGSSSGGSGGAEGGAGGSGGGF